MSSRHRGSNHVHCLLVLFVCCNVWTQNMIQFVDSYSLLPSSLTKGGGVRFQPTPSVLSMAIVGGEDRFVESPKQMVQKGMRTFIDGNVKESIDYFDRADTLAGGTLKPYLWQRGISYYYTNQFQEGSDQVRVSFLGTFTHLY